VNSYGPKMPRRIPVQKRSEETVGYLYEAVARILEQGGDGRLTTNHIADMAGVSIGTLYGYFPDKSALMRAMARHEMARQQEQLQRSLSNSSLSEPPEALVRHVIRAALRPFAARPKVRRRLMQLLMHDTAVLEAARGAQQLVMRSLISALAARWPDQMVCLSDNAQYTLASAIIGAVHAVAIERPEYFETQEFEDEIVDIVVHRTMIPVSRAGL
jgi:AcrR family transcriptional regulator